MSTIQTGRFTLNSLFWVLSFLTVSLVFSFTANSQTINREWKSSEENLSLRFTDNTLGKRFFFNKGELSLQGKWEQVGEQINLNYKFDQQPDTNIITRDVPVATYGDTLVDGSKPIRKIVDTIVVFKRPLPIPKALSINKLDENNLVLKSDTKNLNLAYIDDRSALDKIFANSILRGIIGILSMLFICFLLSRNRKRIDWRLVGTGICIQIIFALLILKVAAVRGLFEYMSYFFVKVLEYTNKGSEFVFGGLVSPDSPLGFIFAFNVLPTVVFFSALTSLLYYLGILQKIVFAFAWVMSRLMRLSGAESLAAAANIFIGQTEAPLVVKPYLDQMSRSEIMCLMTGGMATIAGGVFAAYVGFLGGDDPVQQLEFAKHLLSASIMSAPAAIVAAKILYPETDDTINRDLKISKDKIGGNVLDAISNGTTEGLKLAVNVGAMVLVFLALVEMANSILFDLVGHYSGLNDYIVAATNGAHTGLRLEFILGYLFAPIAWLLGVSGPDIFSVGRLLGEKTILNEFIAYASMGGMKDAGILIEEKSLIIATYALCGFANFGSIGIQLGGIGAIAPNQRRTLSELGLLALVGGTVAAFLTAIVAGMMYQ